ncbi:MAG TPA: methylmalonyl-CoA epimerase [Verrucomicrobiae bacterium]|nr:methylmalonyl-CoA epimerase [Verrucomicrobiae bacterium]
MNYKIDHLGIAVRNLKESVEFYLKNFGGEPSRVFESDADSVLIQFVHYGNQRIELLQPITKYSPIARFLEKNGPGLHHLCFGVQNIVTELARLKTEGFRLIDEVPRIGAEGKKIAFLHPKSSGGVLIELKETA